ncbi:MAG: hypothetical protein VW257_01010, partial [Quisquiliibacterium sp.]
VDTVMAMPQGSRLMILAPARTDRKGGHQELFEDLRAQGFVRVRVRTHGQDHQAGQSTAQNDSASPATPDAPRVYELEGELPRLARNQRHSIDVVIDRIKVGGAIKQRLAESFETALRLADGRALVQDMDSNQERVFSNRFACPVCDYSLRELEPR